MDGSKVIIDFTRMLVERIERHTKESKANSVPHLRSYYNTKLTEAETILAIWNSVLKEGSTE